jgi:starvation-inducible DNA-binding protein
MYMPRIRPSPVVPHLLREEANSVQLYLQYKGYHWNVAGPLFRELHLLFDEHAERILGTIDELAERQLILGSPAPYGLRELRHAASVPADEELPSSPREMIERLLAAHREIDSGLHEAFRVAEQAEDPGSSDLFARCLQIHEKMEWVLSELARQGPPSPAPESRSLRPSSQRPAGPATFAPSGFVLPAPPGSGR